MKYELNAKLADKGHPAYTTQELLVEIKRVLAKELYLEIESLDVHEI